MKCRDISEILDNRSRAKLSVAESREAEEHVAGCADCARDWSVEYCLASLPDLMPTADFQASCRALVAGRPLPAPKTNVRRRIFVGTIAALAAAAAIVTLLPRHSAPTPPSGSLRQPDHNSAPAVIDEEIVGESVDEARPQEDVVESAPPLRFTVRLLMPDSAARSGNGATNVSSASFYGPEMGEQVDAYVSDPIRKRALSSLYVALVGELRTIPGLALVESDLPATDPPFRHYQVNVGFSIGQTPDGKFLRVDDRYVPLGIAAGLKRPDGKVAARPLSGFAIDLQADCRLLAADDKPCPDIPGTAATIVRTLREKVFPPDPSVPRELQAKLKDTKGDPAGRFKALLDLFSMQNNFLDPSLLRDPQVVRAVLDLAAGADAKLRAQIWRAMRGVGNPDLIQPLMNSMLQDPDEVRLAAVALLAADFRGDTRVKALLYSIAAEDRQPLVRALAERGLSGEAWWNSYIVRSLNDPARPAAQRVEALVYELYPLAPLPQGENWSNRMSELLDDAALQGLAEALPNAGTLQGDKSLAGSLMSNVGYRFNKNPAITAMLLQVLEHDTLSRNRTIAGEVLARTHPNDPQVRDALDKAMQSDPDPRVRDWVRQVLGIKAPLPVISQ